jgi:hypothetical protein
MSKTTPPAGTKAPPVTFYTFVVSLGQAAMQHLSTENPSEDDLLIAANTIQTLALLQDKTQGNLDDEEGKLLEAILAELQSKLPSGT